MQEYTARAVILRKDPARELDLRVTMFTDQFGKITAKATSGRKITSKLSAHLEPGTLSFIRLAEKGGLQLTDALKQAKLPLAPHDLHALDILLPPEEQDLDLWGVFAALAGGEAPSGEDAAEGRAKKWDWEKVLALLGWDPREALCEKCRVRKPEYFMLANQSLYCAQCAAASRIPRDALLYIGNDAERMGIGGRY